MIIIIGNIYIYLSNIEAFSDSKHFTTSLKKSVAWNA